MTEQQQSAIESQPEVQSVSSKPEKNGWRTFGIVMITFLVTIGVGYWVVSVYLFPDKFTPVTLNQKEQGVLDRKLNQLGVDMSAQGSNGLEPEPYSEEGASREIHFSEKELNAILARNTDLATKLAIDLSDNLASAKLLLQLDPDLPLLGGNTLKVTAGMEFALANGAPVAKLKGVSVWGVPLPNAWLGNMKNINLIDEFGQSGGFWQAINDGVERIEIREGELMIKLKP